MRDEQNIELEYKFKVTKKQLATIIGVLDKIAIKKINRQYQMNIMFDNQKGLMQSTNGRIRVRILGETGCKAFTYKKPLPSEGGIKRELEYEINFEDKKDCIEEILKAMGFVPTTSYERYQTKWEIDEVQVTFDEYPFSSFIEIEGPKEKINQMAEKLGFSISESLIDPVDTLFQKWRKEQDLSPKTHMKFDDFNT